MQYGLHIIFLGVGPCAIIATLSGGGWRCGESPGSGTKGGSLCSGYLFRQTIVCGNCFAHQDSRGRLISGRGVKAAATRFGQPTSMNFTNSPLVDTDDLRIFSGNSHPGLAKNVCDYLGMPVGQAEVFKFANDNSFVRIMENIRQRDVFIIQPTGAPVNDNLMELLIMIDACKRASAGRITAVIPYYGYGRTDKKDQPRVPITARLVADLLTTAGADRLLTVDLHAGQIQGFFNIPVDELTAMTILADYFKAKEIDDLVVVAVDIGISKRARDVAEYLDCPLAIIEKRRIDNADHSETLNVIGDVEGKVALTFDDEILTGGTTINAGQALMECGVTQVYACATHPVFASRAYDAIDRSDYEEVVVTDTLPLNPEKKQDKVKVLSVASLLGEAISRIHVGQSVGELFSTRSYPEFPNRPS